MSTTESLHETLRLAQRLGFFGSGAVETAIEHAGHFVDAVPEGPIVVYDLGSGGGLPGLVIAHERQQAIVHLIERRQTRADFLQRAVSRLGFEDRVSVETTDVALLARDPAISGTADVVTARGFAQPLVLAPLAAGLARPGGLIVVSDPPGSTAHQRWLELPLESWSLAFASTDGVVSVLRRSAEPSPPRS